MRRVPQPPIDPARRDPEIHGFWVGFLMALLGLGLACYGARRLTAIETVAGDDASEAQLTKACSSSGLEFPDQAAPARPPKPDESLVGMEALGRWQHQLDSFTPPAWKVRVDTAAKTPCPT
jgi:hypothetical protein